MKNLDQKLTFYFCNSFWGQEFRTLFLNLSLASLLSKNNLPKLSCKTTSKYLICTTSLDWDYIQEEKLFLKLKGLISVEFIELKCHVPDFLKPIIAEMRRIGGLDVPNDQSDWDKILITPQECLQFGSFEKMQAIGDSLGLELNKHHEYALKIMFMSLGHKIGAQRAYENGVTLAFMGADLILGDGLIPALEKRMMRKNCDVLLLATLRFSQESCLRELREKKILIANEPLTISNREMVSIMFRNQHPETSGFDFSSPYFCDVATSSYWEVPDDDGVLLHFMNFYPIAVYYGNLLHHDDAYFEKGGTIDGRYISMHFQNANSVGIIQDTDEMMVASLTPHGDYFYPVSTNFLKNTPLLGDMFKTFLIRKTMNSPMGDPIKRLFYTKGIKIHSKDLSEKWSTVEKKAAKIASNASKHPLPFDILWSRLDSLLSASPEALPTKVPISRRCKIILSRVLHSFRGEK